MASFDEGDSRALESRTMRIGEYSLLRRRPLLAFLVSASLVALAVAIRLVAGDRPGGYCSTAAACI